MLRRTYEWTMALAERPNALWLLGAISLIECSLFPIPPDVLLIPMVLARRDRWFSIALVCSVTSLVGAYFGYAIGAFLFEQVGRPLLTFYGYLPQFQKISGLYNHYGTWIVFFTSFTPIPFKVITIFSGATGLDPLTFGLASFISRSIRFYMEAILLWKFGEPIKIFIDRHLHRLALVFFVLLLGGFATLRFL